jgi:predicted alpha/beta superfamily hydrolase
VEDDGSPLGQTEVHYLKSGAVGDGFKIFIGHCGDQNQSRVPVLYLTDANGFFGAAVDIVRLMQLARHLPPLLIVGIGYRANTLGDTIAPRTRDLTPTSDAGFAGLFPEQSVMGGAGAFLRFIEAELKPWVAGRYDIAAEDAVYFGHSFGGLFGTYVFLTAPASFRRYILGSPSMWWDHGALFEVARSGPPETNGRPAVVYIGVGADETHEGRQREDVNLPAEDRAKGRSRRIDMVADAARLAEMLRHPASAAGPTRPGTDVDFEVFAGEFHVTVPFLVLSRGLRRVFDAPR